MSSPTPLTPDPSVVPKSYPTTAFSRLVDGAIRRAGEMSSWAWIVLMVIIILNVFMRYALGEGRIEFEELQWHLYSFGFLLALSYCFVDDGHVRVDILHHNWSLTTRAWVELFGLLFFLLPFVGFVLWNSFPFVADAWITGESSAAPGGLPYRWLIKAVMPLGLGMLLLVSLSRLTRVIAQIWLAVSGNLKKAEG